MIRAAAAFAIAVAAAAPAGAVVILDSTWREEGGSPAHPAAGFGAHIAFAHEDQFDAAVDFSTDGDTWGECSGTWIGNDASAGYVLTAAHCFNDGYTAKTYVYESEGGALLVGDALFVHPEWSGSFDYRTGYDLAIVKLTAPVMDAGPQPLIYAGTKEKGRLLSFAGFGGRGIGSSGDQDAYYGFSNRWELKAAGQGVIDQVVEAITPMPKRRKDAGNYLGIFLPKEDGSVSNPYGGSTKPATRLAGLLGSGDSGSGGWIRLDDGSWALVGVASNGSGEAQYGDSSWFVRLSTHRDWIASVFPGAAFVAD